MSKIMHAAYPVLAAHIDVSPRPPPLAGGSLAFACLSGWKPRAESRFASDGGRSDTLPHLHNDAFSVFRHAVGRDFASSRQVSHYARQLGYSARTLSWVTLAPTGNGAKEFIDARVVLEAKRLLAHGDPTVMECAHRLGFHDAANFRKFFEQRAGLTPGAFRKSGR